MRVIFFGTPEFAVPTLEKLLAAPDFGRLGVDFIQPWAIMMGLL